eukprot:4523205-Amphidinium_carterae.1
MMIIRRALDIGATWSVVFGDAIHIFEGSVILEIFSSDCNNRSVMRSDFRIHHVMDFFCVS